MPFATPPRRCRDALIDWAWESVPHHEEFVSGDALFVEEARPDDRLMFLLIDVMGHAREAAFVVNLFRTFYLADDFTHGKSPVQLLHVLLSMIAEHYNGRAIPPGADDAADRAAVLERYTTALAILFNPSTGEAELASAAIPHPFLLPADGSGPQTLPLSGFVLGPWEVDDLPTGEPFDTVSLTLSPGSRLLAYTDGVSEAVPAEGCPPRPAFYPDRMREVLTKIAANAPVAEQVSLLIDQVKSYVERDWPRDDTTAVLWKFGPSNS